jgi:hypothetical protein
VVAAEVPVALAERVTVVVPPVVEPIEAMVVLLGTEPVTAAPTATVGPDVKVAVDEPLVVVKVTDVVATAAVHSDWYLGSEFTQLRMSTSPPSEGEIARTLPLKLMVAT